MGSIPARGTIFMLTHPTVLDSTFLSADEVLDIESKIFALRKHWNQIYGSFYMLPRGMYNIKQPYAEVVAEYNHLMIENFSVYYERIKDLLSAHYGISVAYAPDKLLMPGFHVFMPDKDTGMTYRLVNFHRDEFPALNNIVDRVGKIDSAIVPIKLPMSGGSLLWKDEQDTQHRFEYTPGQLALWPGEMFHSIAPFMCRHRLDGRITMQMHVNILEDSAVVFW